MRHRPISPTRRRWLKRSLAAATLPLVGTAATGFPYLSRTAALPRVTHGVQAGDVDAQSGMIWSRADRPAQAWIEVATSDSFAVTRMLPPIYAMPSHDFAIKCRLTGLAPGQPVFYRIRFADLADLSAVSEPVVGSFRAAPLDARSIRFCWSGDTAGQGWGIDRDRGGMLTYAAMAGRDPDFFIHCGDSIYADNPIPAERKLSDGTLWKNRVEEHVEKVAESLNEFRGRWKYNLLDEHVRAMSRRVPTFFLWDDHEVINNWSPGKDLHDDDRYTEKSLPLLVARAKQALHEMTPIRHTPAEPGRIYRKVPYGPLLDLFFVDLRSYRDSNTDGMQRALTPASAILGARQRAWLKARLADSRAVWKVVASDMPIGVVRWENWRRHEGVEAVANGDPGAPLGRELEFAELLKFIHIRGIENVVWFTADVHYTAAHYYNPDTATFKDFTPFWEFVSGPLHAGTFGPSGLDATFGPELKFQAVPARGLGGNLPPSMGLQFFGLVDIDGNTAQMSVRLMNRADQELYSVTLDPVRG